MGQLCLNPLRPLRTSGCLLLVLYIFTVLRLTHFFFFFFFRPVQKMENMCQPVQTHPPVICPPQTLHCRLHYFSALGNIRLVEWGKYTINISFLALFFFLLLLYQHNIEMCFLFFFFLPDIMSAEKLSCHQTINLSLQWLMLARNFLFPSFLVWQSAADFLCVDISGAQWDEPGFYY